MSNQGRVLSDEEQNKEVKHILLKLEILYASKHRIQESNKPLNTIQYLSEKADSQAEDILNGFINTQKRLYAESVIGEAPKPFINGKHPERGDTVQIDLDNNYQESLKFIQDNGAYTLWAEQRARINR